MDRRDVTDLLDLVCGVCSVVPWVPDRLYRNTNVVAAV